MQKKKKMTLEEFQENETPGLLAIYDFTSNIAISNYIDTTAVKIPEACYSSSLLAKTHFLSETYLMNRKRSSMDMGLSYGVMGYSSFSVRGSIVQRILAEKEELEHKNLTIQLPKYKHIKMPLGTAIRARRSIRKMTDAAMTIEELSTILYYADGVTGELTLQSEEKDPLALNTLGDNCNATLRSAPSGGGLFPITLYMVLRNVNDVDDGIYYYLPLEHSIRLVKKLDGNLEDDINHVAEWGINIEQKKINVIFFYVYSLYNNSRKYSDMAYDFAMVEVGQISENIQLTCTAEGIASCDIGGFEKYKCENFLEIDGLTKNIVNVTIIGK